MLPYDRRPPIKYRRNNCYRKTPFGNKHSNNSGEKSQWTLKLAGESGVRKEIFT